ncbi:hypothetical protein BC829DRAFT_420909 [Chytridium lagenaria]|nr:hypothetical protein BC829DRAFT_420909 [Chytridium lagenaria]
MSTCGGGVAYGVGGYLLYELSAVKPEPVPPTLFGPQLATAMRKASRNAFLHKTTLAGMAALFFVGGTYRLLIRHASRFQTRARTSFVRMKGTLKEDLEDVPSAVSFISREHEKSMKAVDAYMKSIDLVPPKISNAPLWNESLSSNSEASVKADRAPHESIEIMQKKTIEIVTAMDLSETVHQSQNP